MSRSNLAPLSCIHLPAIKMIHPPIGSLKRLLFGVVNLCRKNTNKLKYLMEL